MRNFLLRSALYIFPIILFCLPIDFFLSKGLSNAHDYAQDEYAVWNDLYAGTINADVDVYGSSRAWVHINPAMIKAATGLKAYNLGIDGHNFSLQYLRHQLLLERNKQPRFIIYSLDMFTLEEKKDLYNSDQFLPYLFFNSQLHDYLKNYNGFKLPDYYLPLARFYGRQLAIKKAMTSWGKQFPPGEVRVDGYMGNDVDWNEDFEKAKVKMQYFEVKTDTALVSWFDRFLVECRDKNIKLVFVYTPEYIKGQHFVKNRSEIMELYSAFAEKYSIPFLDYSNDSMCYDKNYFYNASHLRKAGAEIFTGKLISDLEGLHFFETGTGQK